MRRVQTDGREESHDAGAVFVDVDAVLRGDDGQGALWNRETGDLDVNVVAFPAGAGVGAHVNSQVDVLVVVVSGEGEAQVGEQVYRLTAGTALLIPKGTPRAIRGVRGRLVYLTCHPRRPRLLPAAAARSERSPG
jgi:quercetin dioxygenase-like cupin family protein